MQRKREEGSAVGRAQGWREQGGRRGKGAGSGPALAIAGKVGGYKVRVNPDSGGPCIVGEI